jgi:D-lactate dehydrogenase (cytochrome)
LVPETVNDIIGRRKKDIPGLHKIATDAAVPEGRLREFLLAARSVIEKEGVEYVVFGHIGDNHLHINILPNSSEEMEKAEDLFLRISEESVRLGGTVSAEHGIGRLKKHLLRIQFSEDELKAMKAVKDALDPEWVLNPGVMFSDPLNS